MNVHDAPTSLLLAELFRRACCRIGLHDWAYWSEAMRDVTTGHEQITRYQKHCVGCGKTIELDPRTAPGRMS